MKKPYVKNGVLDKKKKHQPTSKKLVEFKISRNHISVEETTIISFPVFKAKKHDPL